MGAGRFRHEFGGGFREMAGLAGSDVEAAGEHTISITPIKMPVSGYKMFAWEKIDELVELGYREAMEKLTPFADSIG